MSLLVKSTLMTLTLSLSSLSAFADVGSAYKCLAPSRGGIKLSIPGLTDDGDIEGPLKITRGTQTIREVSADRLTDYLNDGEKLSIVGVDSKGRQTVSIKGSRKGNSALIVQAQIKDAGLIAFTCKELKKERKEKPPVETAPEIAPEIAPSAAAAADAAVADFVAQPVVIVPN